MSATPNSTVHFLGRALSEATRLRPFIPTYFHLLLSAIFPIYTGAHASLSRPSSAAKPEKKKRKVKLESDDESDSENEDIVVQKMEGLSPSDAIMFPLMAGVTLTSLYFIIKWLKDPALLNKILRYYFSHMGLFFSIRFLKDAFSIIRSFIFPDQYTYRGSMWKVNSRRQHFEKTTTTAHSTTMHELQCSPFPSILSRFHFSKSTNSFLWSIRAFLYGKATLRLHIKSLFTLKCLVDVLDLTSTVISVGLSIYSLMWPTPWYLTNFFGFAFCYGSLQFMSPTTFWTGTLILSSLFIYDIYFVFFTPLMVTVATKLDVPIKLLFPRPPAPDTPTDVLSLAMLGLGDIVVPGMLIGLALRFDLYMHYLRQQVPLPGNGSKDDRQSIEKKPYLRATGHWGERFWTKSSSEKAGDTNRIDTISSSRFTKPYFTASMIGYLIGMMTTLGVMQIAEHAQPALLYLVPGVLSSLWGTAFVRGEIHEMWNFTEEEKDEKPGDGVTQVENESALDIIRSFLGFPTKKPQQSNAEKERRKSQSGEIEATVSNGQSHDGESKEGKKEKSKEKDKRKDTSRQLIGFSIELPRKKEGLDMKSKDSKDDGDGLPRVDDGAFSSKGTSTQRQLVEESAAASATGIESADTGASRPNKRTRVL